MNGGPQRRVSSPSGLSTLMTSAPRSASVCPVVGPASTRASSTTRTPASALIAGDPALCCARESKRPLQRVNDSPLDRPSDGPPPPLRRGGRRLRSSLAAKRRGRGTLPQGVRKDARLSTGYGMVVGAILP